MREIKCRGKRVDNGEWITGYFLKDEITGQCFIFALGNSVNESERVGEEGCLKLFAFEVDEETVGPYTGLKDFKRTEEFPEGQEIYEGDIIECKCKFDNKYYIAHFMTEIEWDETMGGFLFQDSEYSWVGMEAISDGGSYTCEVIGNIYDNPELLKGGSHE